jgi:large subunit ribosomal protein L25
LPAFIEVDLSELKGGQSIHLSELKLPEGVELVEVLRGHDGVVAQASAGKRAAS